MDQPNSLHSTARPIESTSFSRARWMAGALWALAAAQAVFGLVLAAMNELSLTRFVAEYVIVNVASALAFATVGALILTRRPAHAIGWLLCAAGCTFGLATWVSQYARYALVTNPGALPGGPLVGWINALILGPAIALTAIFPPLLFPTGGLPSPRWRGAAWFAVASTLLFTLALAISPGPVDASLPEVTNPFAPPGAAAIAGVLGPLAIALMLVSLAFGAAAPIVRFRHARGIERQQIKWFAYATAILIAAIVLPALLHPASILDPANGDTFWSGLLVAFAFPALATAVGIAILRHRLYDIDILIQRTLIYGALTLCIAGLYVLVVGYIGTLLNARGNLFVALFATGLVAIVFQPLRERLQRAVNQLLFGDRDDPYAVLARLGQRLDATLAPDAVLPAIVDTVAQALKLPYAAIAHDTGERESTIVAATGAIPAAPTECHSIDLSYQGQTLGQLLVAPRPGESHFNAADLRLLDDVARQAGIALHAVRLHTHALELAADLQQSRERLVAAREEERRRLRRDLHDGLGPALAGLTFKIDAAHRQLAVDAEAAGALLLDLKGNVQEAIADIRRLVYALRPPALDELGLVGALRLHAESYQQSALQIRLDAPPEWPPLPAAVEVAAYRIVSEALTNVGRHAHARNCQISLALDDGLEIEVRDDGQGLPTAHRHGIGLHSMRERAEELGGTCRVEPAEGGGTRVWARLPLA